MNDCVFCRIVKGELPCYKVYEDDDFLAFLDAFPVNPGHVLVIPKKHVRWVWDVENIGDYYKVVQKIANAQRKAFNTDFVVSLVLGEEVPHAHVWLVPRLKDDGHGSAINIGLKKKFSDEEMKEFQKKIVDSLQSPQSP